MPASHPACIEQAAFLLRRGQLVCYPTDTVYGIGAVASNEDAVRRLYAVKGRSPDKPLPLLIAEAAQASFYAEVTPPAKQLMSRFWPGPLTIVMPKAAAFRSRALPRGCGVDCGGRDGPGAGRRARGRGGPGGPGEGAGTGASSQSS